MKKHLLLVDDDTLMRRSLTFGLERAGYKTTSAANAEDALEIAGRQHPDLVILDIIQVNQSCLTGKPAS